MEELAIKSLNNWEKKGKMRLIKRKKKLKLKKKQAIMKKIVIKNNQIDKNLAT